MATLKQVGEPQYELRLNGEQFEAMKARGGAGMLEALKRTAGYQLLLNQDELDVLALILSECGCEPVSDGIFDAIEEQADLEVWENTGGCCFPQRVAR